MREKKQVHGGLQEDRGWERKNAGMGIGPEEAWLGSSLSHSEILLPLFSFTKRFDKSVLEKKRWMFNKIIMSLRKEERFISCEGFEEKKLLGVHITSRLKMFLILLSTDYFKKFTWKYVYFLSTLNVCMNCQMINYKMHFNRILSYVLLYYINVFKCESAINYLIGHGNKRAVFYWV